MRRIVVCAAVMGFAVLVVGARRAKLHERLMARCEHMMAGMPDDFPPKKAFRSIEEIRRNTAQILDLLQETKRTESANPLDTQLESTGHAA